MATTLASFEAGHGDMVHDVALDYYGRRLATASSDRCIKVFDVVGEQVGRAPGMICPFKCYYVCAVLLPVHALTLWQTELPLL